MNDPVPDDPMPAVTLVRGVREGGAATQAPVAHGLFRRESLEAHLATAHDAEALRVAPPWSQAMFWLASSLLVLPLVLSLLFDVEQTGFARGILRVEGGVQTMVAQSAGTVLEVDARSGQVVPAKELLVRIDSPQTRSQLLDAERQIALAEQRLQDFGARRDKNHAERVRLLELRAGLLMARAKKQEETVTRLRDKHRTYGRLAKEGLSSELQKGDVAEEVAAAERELLRLREDYTQTKSQVADIDAELVSERSSLEGSLTQARDKRDALALQVTQTDVRAPRAGRLEAMLVRPGDAVAVGSPIGKLVPTDAPRQVVVFVSERDRAFLAVGAPARLEMDQLPVGEFGSLTGKVARISTDLASASEIADAFGDAAKVTEPVFRVELVLEASENLTRLETVVRPGSLVTARFALRKRRIITVLFEPMRRFFA